MELRNIAIIAHVDIAAGRTFLSQESSAALGNPAVPDFRNGKPAGFPTPSPSPWAIMAIQFK